MNIKFKPESDYEVFHSGIVQLFSDWLEEYFEPTKSIQVAYCDYNIISDKDLNGNIQKKGVIEFGINRLVNKLQLEYRLEILLYVGIQYYTLYGPTLPDTGRKFESMRDAALYLLTLQAFQGYT